MFFYHKFIFLLSSIKRKTALKLPSVRITISAAFFCNLSKKKHLLNVWLIVWNLS